AGFSSGPAARAVPSRLGSEHPSREARKKGPHAGLKPRFPLLTVLLKAPGGIFGACVLIGLVALALLAPYLAPYSPFAISQSIPLAAPSNAHPFGTDDLGRD